MDPPELFVQEVMTPIIWPKEADYLRDISFDRGREVVGFFSGLFPPPDQWELGIMTSGETCRRLFPGT